MTACSNENDEFVNNGNQTGEKNAIMEDVYKRQAYMSIGQSVLQSVYSFQLILLPSINTDNNIQIAA